MPLWPPRPLRPGRPAGAQCTAPPLSAASLLRQRGSEGAVQPGSPASRSASPPRSLASAPSGPLDPRAAPSSARGRTSDRRTVRKREMRTQATGLISTSTSTVLKYSERWSRWTTSPARDTSTLLLDARDRPARDTHTAADAERIHAAVAYGGHLGLASVFGIACDAGHF